MSLKIYNSQSKSKELFSPLNPPHVTMYVCGVTVYDFCHIGHARAAVVFDMISRYLRHKNYKLRYVRNFTDIDDKIIQRSQKSNIDWRELTQKFITAFNEDMQALGNIPPDDEPKATEYISAMHEIIIGLEKQGLAYASKGDVFFAVRKFPSYGALSHKNIEELESGARVDIQESKKDPLDFALWKAAKPGEPFWESPWGQGRPGWHIECSAMSTKLLGHSIDIHGGGKDLIFPHHENERAQSEGCYKQTFARYWIHNGFVNLNADKMSKSTGNFLTIRDVIKMYSAETVRYFLLSVHYRSPIDFSEKNLLEAQNAIERVYATLQRFQAFTSSQHVPTPAGAFRAALEIFPTRFHEAMDDDFNSAQALGYLFDLIREANKFFDTLEAENSRQIEAELSEQFQSCTMLVQNTLGLFTQDADQFFQEKEQKSLAQLNISESDIAQFIQERLNARKEKNYARADEIRDELLAQGIILKDHPDGTTTWTSK